VSPDIEASICNERPGSKNSRTSEDSVESLTSIILMPSQASAWTALFLSFMFTHCKAGFDSSLLTAKTVLLANEHMPVIITLSSGKGIVGLG
jgi:hypothetical protein